MSTTRFSCFALALCGVFGATLVSTIVGVRARATRDIATPTPAPSSTPAPTPPQPTAERCAYRATSLSTGELSSSFVPSAQSMNVQVATIVVSLANLGTVDGGTCDALPPLDVAFDVEPGGDALIGRLMWDAANVATDGNYTCAPLGDAALRCGARVPQRTAIVVAIVALVASPSTFSVEYAGTGTCSGAACIIDSTPSVALQLSYIVNGEAR